MKDKEAWCEAGTTGLQRVRRPMIEQQLFVYQANKVFEKNLESLFEKKIQQVSEHLIATNK